MNPELLTVERVFNAFASCVDAVDTMAKERGRDEVVFLREELAKTALFTFEKSTCDRVFALAKERGTAVPMNEVQLPFDRVALADDLGVVHIHLNGETDDGAVLRRMSVVVYLHHLNKGAQWMMITGVVDYVNGLQLDPAEVREKTISIDPRTEGDTNNIIRLHGSLTAIMGDGKHTVVRRLADVLPAMRDAEIPENADENTVTAFITRDFISSLSSAIEQLYYVNQPRHHVVELTPHHIVKNADKYNRQSKVKAARFADRIRYLLVEPEKVHEIRPPSASSGGTHASPVPHLRAGYTKILRAARFKKRRWAVVHVRPTWVGDEEWDNGKVRYRVIAPGARL
jgi:hypothetical protein